jgi:hypothetical protein
MQEIVYFWQNKSYLQSDCLRELVLYFARSHMFQQDEYGCGLSYLSLIASDLIDLHPTILRCLGAHLICAFQDPNCAFQLSFLDIVLVGPCSSIVI